MTSHDTPHLLLQLVQEAVPNGAQVVSIHSNVKQLNNRNQHSTGLLYNKQSYE